MLERGTISVAVGNVSVSIVGPMWDPFLSFNQSVFSGPWPTRPARLPRRSPPRIDRHLSVLPEGRAAQHARTRGKEPRDPKHRLTWERFGFDSGTNLGTTFQLFGEARFRCRGPHEQRARDAALHR